MHVVEIGCGRDPGPRFEAAHEYYIVDTDPNLLIDAVRMNEGFKPIPTSADNLPFEDSSVGAVVARNLFSAPLLQIKSELPISEFLSVTNMFPEDVEDTLEAYHSLQDKTHVLKLRIMAEVSRILSQNGKLVIADHKTRYITDEFLRRLEADPDRSDDLVIARAEIEDITPEEYWKVIKPLNPKVWVGTKQEQ